MMKSYALLCFLFSSINTINILSIWDYASEYGTGPPERVALVLVQRIHYSGPGPRVFNITVSEPYRVSILPTGVIEVMNSR